MDGITQKRVNINTASMEELTNLPGVGPGLAARIEEKRPFNSEEDLLEVKGIGNSLLSQIKPLLSFNSYYGEELREGHLSEITDEAVPVLDTLKEEPRLLTPGKMENKDQEEMDTEAEEQQKEFSPPILVREAEQEKETSPRRDSRPLPSMQKEGANAFSRGNTIWLLAGTSFISVLAAVLVTLLVLVLINGSLRIDRNENFLALSRQAEVLSEELDLLAEDLSVVEQKLIALEGLSGRMTMVEGQIDTIQTRVDQAASDVELMQETVRELHDQTTVLSNRVSVFDTFFTGLQELLGSVFNFEQPAIENGQ